MLRLDRSIGASAQPQPYPTSDMPCALRGEALEECTMVSTGDDRITRTAQTNVRWPAMLAVIVIGMADNTFANCLEKDLGSGSSSD